MALTGALPIKSKETFRRHFYFEFARSVSALTLIIPKGREGRKNGYPTVLSTDLWTPYLSLLQRCIREESRNDVCGRQK